MSLLDRLWHAAFGREPVPKEQQLDKEQLEALAVELSKRELKFSDADIKRIANDVVVWKSEQTKDDPLAQRIAHKILDQERDLDRLVIRIIRTPRFFLRFGLFVLLFAVFSYWSIWKSFGDKVDKENKVFLDTLREKNQVTLLSFEAEVRTNIEASFKEPRISNTVVSVASAEATNLLLKQIYPVLTNFEDTVSNSFVRIEEFNASLKQSQTAQSNLQAVINEANDAVGRLDQDSDFVTKAILAENDDRSAYEQLVKWSKDDDYRNQKPAQEVSFAIRTSYYDVSARAWGVINWSDVQDSTNRNSWKMPYIMGVWNALNQHLAMDYLSFVFGQTNITKEQRLSFLRNVYSGDSHNSLLAAHTAAQKTSAELGASYSVPLEYANIEKRWQEYSTTNHLWEIPANSPTNVSYDIIPASATNRFQILKNWGRTEFVLFQLEHTPIQGSLEAKFIDYNTCNEDILLPTYTNYFNTRQFILMVPSQTPL